MLSKLLPSRSLLKGRSVILSDFGFYNMIHMHILVDGNIIYVCISLENGPGQM